MQLSKAEEQLMQHLWDKEKAFVKEILELYPDPKPATTTLLTLLKRMMDKGFVSYKLFGNSRQYKPLVSKKDYFSKHLNGLIKDFFDDNSAQFASFFTQQADLSKKELEVLKEIIESELKRK